MNILRSRPEATTSDRTVNCRALAAIVLTVGLAACSGDGGSAVPPSEIGHVHDLIIDEGDTILVATHRGLLRLDDGSYRRVGDEVHDLMAMTRDNHGDIVASGHPDLRFEQYRVDGAPSFLGLARSSDGGETWEIIGLLGEADFHALSPTEDGLLAGDSTGTIWRFDADGDGQPVGSIQFDINDLAVSPDDAAVVAATSYDGDVAVSDDAGQTWEIEGGAPPIVEIEWTDQGVLGSTADGELWAASSPSVRFERVRDAPGEVDTLLVSEDGVWAATHDGQIYRQEHDSWTPLVRSDD